MRIKVTKYILALSVILMACFGYLYRSSPAATQVYNTGHHVTHIDSKQKNADHVESLLSAYDANKAKFTTDNNDNEEEFSGGGKKLLKAGSFFISSFYSRCGFLSLSYQKCVCPLHHFVAYSPTRLFIKFRVIRL